MLGCVKKKVLWKVFKFPVAEDKLKNNKVTEDNYKRKLSAIDQYVKSKNTKHQNHKIFVLIKTKALVVYLHHQVKDDLKMLREFLLYTG